jgi:hypothetical protein
VRSLESSKNFTWNLNNKVRQEIDPIGILFINMVNHLQYYESKVIHSLDIILRTEKQYLRPQLFDMLLNLTHDYMPLLYPALQTLVFVSLVTQVDPFYIPYILLKLREHTL